MANEKRGSSSTGSPPLSSRRGLVALPHSTRPHESRIFWCFCRTDRERSCRLPWSSRVSGTWCVQWGGSLTACFGSVFLNSWALSRKFIYMVFCFIDLGRQTLSGVWPTCWLLGTSQEYLTYRNMPPHGCGCRHRSKLVTLSLNFVPNLPGLSEGHWSVYRFIFVIFWLFPTCTVHCLGDVYGLMI